MIELINQLKSLVFGHLYDIGKKTIKMYRLDFKTSEIMLVDWVNSLDIESCSLVNSLSDLRSGDIPLEILSYLKSTPITPIHSSPHTKNQILSNWTTFISELPDTTPQSIIPKPQDIIEVIPK